MFKLVVLSALLAVAIARPGHIHSPIAKHTVVETQGYANVGEIVEHVPTAVSHQSSTVVHNKAAVVTPIVAPVVHKTIIAEAPVHHGHHGDAELVHHTLVAEAPVHHHGESHIVATAPVHHGDAHIIAAAPAHHGDAHIIAAAPEHHHGEAQFVITVPEHLNAGHYEHLGDEGHFDAHYDGQYDNAGHDEGHYAHEHDEHDDGHYDHQDHESYQHHNGESIVIESAPLVGQHHGGETVLVSSPVQHHDSSVYAHHVAEPAVVYTAAPAEHHHVHGEGETKSVSKTYVAEPDSVRYTEQTHSAPHHQVKYVTAPIVQHKTILSAPIVKYVHAEPEHHHHW